MRTSLAFRLAACVVAGAAVVCCGFGYLNLRLERKHLEETVIESADRVGDLIQRSTRHDMLQNNRESLYQSIRDLGAGPGIQLIRIFNNEGKIRFSTLASEDGTTVDKQAEACYGCHRRDEPLTKLDRKDRWRIFSLNSLNDERILGVIRPIENEPACSNAACHAHPASLRVLGVIDAHLSLATVDARSNLHRRQIVGTTLLALMLVCGVMVLFVWKLVYRPVRELIAGTRQVAQGDLHHRLEVRSDDELGEMAESFNKMTAELEIAKDGILARAERMASLGKLAATVAHEVNNPLMGIMTYARLTRKSIEKAVPPPQDKERLVEQLETIEHESRRCGDLMRNLLMFSRQSSRTLADNDVNTLVQRAITLVRHQMEINGIALEQNLASEPMHVMCDAGQIQQVVLGLMVNAMEAMPVNSGGKLWVSTAREAAMVVIRVKDNGPGIAPTVMPHLFEPFYTTKTDEQRTGLGLAVAKSIIEQHGGEITVESTEGAGAEFTIRLVAAAEAPVAVEPVQERVP